MFCVLTNQPSNVISFLKLIRDLLNEFTNLVENWRNITQKHGMTLRDVSGFGLAKPESIQELIKTLPPDKLGLFLMVISEIMLMENELKQFTTYDAAQLQKFHERLRGVIEKLDKIVEGL